MYTNISDDSAIQSNHEEADSRMAVHMFHAVSNGMTKFKVITPDSDVVVIFTSALPRVMDINPSVKIAIELQGQNKEYNLNAGLKKMGRPKCEQLLMFHVFTGMLSPLLFFRGRGIA